MSNSSFHRTIERCLQLARLAGGRVRARLFALRGARVGSKVSFGTGCRVYRPWAISVGHRSVFEDAVYLKVVSDSATIEFGSYVFIGRGVEFDVQEKISVGDHSLIAPGCFVTDHEHGISPDLRIDQQPGVATPVTIGNDVWLGANVTVVAGVTIGDGAVVGANAVVTRDVPSMAIVAGVPATILRYRDDVIRITNREKAASGFRPAREIAHRSI